MQNRFPAYASLPSALACRLHVSSRLASSVVAGFCLLLCVLSGCKGDGSKPDAHAVGAFDSAMVARGYEVVTMFKTQTSHLTATFRVNGQPCVFLIDTGGGATLIDLSKQEKFGLRPLAVADYAAGIGSARPLVRTSASIKINEKETLEEELFLMDLAFLNTEFKKTHSRQVDGVLGTDFLDKHQAIIDYSGLKIYLKVDVE